MPESKPLHLVLGASTKPSRYSYLAANRLTEKDFRIYLLGRSEGEVAGVNISLDWPSEKIDTITIYLDPKNQEAYYDLILKAKPRRVIFNPGSENAAFAFLLKEAGIEIEIACTLVMLSTNQY